MKKSLGEEYKTYGENVFDIFKRKKSLGQKYKTYG